MTQEIAVQIARAFAREKNIVVEKIVSARRCETVRIDEVSQLVPNCGMHHWRVVFERKDRSIDPGTVGIGVDEDTSIAVFLDNL